MPRGSRNLRTRHLHWVLLGFLCCALVIFGGIVQLVHTHPDGQAVRPDCALCHVAHLVVQPSVPQLLPRAVPVVARVSTVLQPRRALFFFVFSLFTRPPPAQTANS
jgi:hypothetical protein